MSQTGPAAALSPPTFDSLPYRAEHEPARASALVLLTLLAVLAGIVVVPVVLAVAYASHDIASALAHKPLAFVMLTMGVVAWLSLLTVAVHRVVHTLWCRRSVSITAARVVLANSGLLGATLCVHPLADYRGIVHRVRATLTGVHHELLLVHCRRMRPVLLYAADTITQSTIDRAIALLRLPQLPASELYRLGQAEEQMPPVAAEMDATQPA